MVSAKTSKPDSSPTKAQPLPSFDKLYWLRVGVAALSGIVTQLVQTDYVTGISIGIGIYLVTYYFARFTWYKGLSREGQGKIYTTGIGSYTVMFLFTWMLFFTLQTAGYSV